MKKIFEIIGFESRNKQSQIHELTKKIESLVPDTKRALSYFTDEFNDNTVQWLMENAEEHVANRRRHEMDYVVSMQSLIVNILRFLDEHIQKNKEQSIRITTIRDEYRDTIRTKKISEIPVVISNLIKKINALGVKLPDAK